MTLENLRLQALARSQPLSVHLELTYRCNWRCVFCYNPRHHDREPLSAAEWIEVLDDLRELGTLTLVLTGGEPLAHPQFFEIARSAAARAFALRIFTNGSLIDAGVADAVAALRPLVVELSIHGASADVHDQVTGKPGSFDAMWRAVDLLRHRGVRLILKCPLCRINEHQMDDMVALAQKKELPFLLNPTLTPRDDGDLSPLQYAVSDEGLRRAMSYAVETGSLQPIDRVIGGANCGLGRLTMAIDPEGNVYPCIQWRRSSLGNVRVTRLRTLWRDSPARIEAAAVANAANDRLAGIGGALSAFPYCPALAQQRTGDPLVPDEVFVRQAHLAAELRDRQKTAS